MKNWLKSVWGTAHRLVTREPGGKMFGAYEPHVPNRARQQSKKVLRDLIIVFSVFSLAFVLTTVFDLHGSFEAASLQMKDSPFQYDEVVVALAFLAAALSVFALRRWRELESEIVERIQIEEALVDSEERYRTLAEAAQDFIFIVDRNGLIQYLNSYAATKLGSTQEDLTGKSLDLVLPHEMAQQQNHELAKVFAEGRPVEVETQACFDGEDSWLSTSLVPIRDEDGQFENVLGISRDITQRKLAQDTLEHSKEDLEVMVTKRTEELGSVNRRLKLELDEKKLAEERLQAVNRALRTSMAASRALTAAGGEAELLREICQAVVAVGGYRFAWVGFAEGGPEKLVSPVASAGFGNGYLDAVKVTWDDSSSLGAGPAGKAICTGKPSVVRDVLIDESYAPWRGEALKRGFASTVSLPLKADEESFGSLNIYAAEPDAFDAEEVEHLSELAGDLSYGISAIRTRGERDEQAVALRRTGEQLSLLLQSLPIIFYTSSATDDFGVTYVSDNVTTFTGYTPEEVTTDSSFWMDHIHPDDAPRAFDEIPKVFDRGFHEYEYRWRGADGNYKWFLDILRLVKGPEGEEDYIVGMWLDITARKQGEERLLQVKDQLEEDVKVKSDELAGIRACLDQTVEKLEDRRRQNHLLNKMDELLQSCLTEEEAYAVFARFAGRLTETDSGALYLLDEATHNYAQAIVWGREPPIEKEFGPSDCWSLRLGKIHLSSEGQTGMRCVHAGADRKYLCTPVRLAGNAFGVLVLSPAAADDDDEKMVERRELASSLVGRVGMTIINLRRRNNTVEAATDAPGAADDSSWQGKLRSL
ncbi:MAG: PAS domain S-box protein [Thermoleophilia bacterium]